jgi:hypothetical protein
MSTHPVRRSCDDGLATVVENLRAHVARLEDRIERLERRRRRDSVADGRLLAAVALHFGGALFSVGDVLQHPALAAIIGDPDPRRLGARLKRLHRRGAHTGGSPYILERYGRDERGALWSIAVSAFSHTSACATPDPGAL